MGTSSNARALFDKLNPDYISAEMVGKEFENNWLECKIKEGKDPNGLDESDKSHFAKALSGFANTSGGVLIFGLNARRKDGIDIIQSVEPIKNMAKIESALREQESRLVERAVFGVEYKAIPMDGDQGLIAIFIPESARLPHRSMKDRHFYIRAGGTFQALDLNIIEDLFSRRLRPKLEFILRPLGGNEFMVCLANPGEVTAKDPHVVFRIPDHFNTTGYELDGNTRLHTWVQINDYKGQKGRFLAFQDGINRPVHPSSEIQLLQLRYDLNKPSVPYFSIEYHLSAENMPQVDGSFEALVLKK
ncbi:MAG: ATP-binding protein [Patescibacteria group bacterium]|nr:ATP-binding protein [Patescibacteria group bacterium]